MFPSWKRISRKIVIAREAYADADVKRNLDRRAPSIWRRLFRVSLAGHHLFVLVTCAFACSRHAVRHLLFSRSSSLCFVPRIRLLAHFADTTESSLLGQWSGGGKQKTATRAVFCVSALRRRFLLRCDGVLLVFRECP